MRRERRVARPAVLEPTQSPSAFDRHRARSRQVLVAVFAAGAVLATYGAGTAGLDPAGVAVAPAAVAAYLLLAAGLLLMAVVALVVAWFARQESPRPLPRRAMLVAGTAAPVLATGIVLAGTWLTTGGLPSRPSAAAWLLLVLVALGLQLYVGASAPDARRRVYEVEGACLLAFVVGTLALAGVATSAAGAGAVLAVSAVAVGLFAGLGGAVYLLGYLLVRRPTFHRIR